MSDANAVGGLKWVKGEIVASLRSVHAGLDAVVDGRVDAAQLAGAVAAVNEVRGVLTALQLTGPARLAEEMQYVTEALAEGSVANVREAAEALMLALIQLPDYLDRLQAGHSDVPLVLLPAINDLRESRGVPPLREAELLVPGSVLTEAGVPSPEAQQAMVQVAHRVRRHFHRLLLQWYRGEDARQGLTSLRRLLHQLQRSVRESIFHELFLAAEAVVEGLLDGSIPTDAKTKALIAHLDRVLKPFGDDPAAWPEADAQTLLVAMTEQIARSDSSSYLISELRTAYSLADEVSAAGVTGAAPAPEALAVLTEEVRKELAPVKDMLDLDGLSEGAPYRPGLIAEARTAAERLAGTPATRPAGVVASQPPVPEASVAPAQEQAGGEVAQPAALPSGRIDPEFLDIFLEEAEEEQQSIRDQFARWHRDAGDDMALITLRRSFHTLKGSGRLVGAQRVGDFARAVETLLNRVIECAVPASPALMALVSDAVAVLPDLIAAEAAGRPLNVDRLVARAESLGAPAPAPEPRTPALHGKVIPWPGAAPTPEGAGSKVAAADLAGASAPPEEVDTEAAVEAAVLAEADEELLAIFRREAREHLDVLRSFLADGSADECAAVPGDAPIRALHTLTGSARMTGVGSIAEVTGALEFLAHRARDAAVDGPACALLAQALDAIEVRLGHLPGGGSEIAVLRALARDASEWAALSAATAPLQGEAIAEAAIPAETIPEEAIPEEAIPEEAFPEEAFPEAGIPALAAASALPAGRFEQLPDDAELLAPSPVRPAPAAPTVAEAAAPQIRVRADLLNRLVEDAGEIGIYGSRLARQRSRLGDRLGELDQTLDRMREQLRQLEIETEAQILHRFEPATDTAGPLREAFDPLELDRFSTLQQLSRGLAETVNDLVGLRTLLRELEGELETLLHQQARIADDLQDGLDLAAIRARAVERGLLDPAAEVGAEKIAQLVLEPGFSTVRQVTQIAGMGVGLDVVNAEIKQLSGTFDLDSLPGRGTEITIRLPLTLAILEALLVEVGEQVFAIPHATIEAAARIARQDLEGCDWGEEGAGDFPYAGHHYRVACLGTTLHLPGAPAIDDRRGIPVLLARSGDQRVAFQVDKLLGSQRVVVKPLGHELSGIRWLSGGTILPDGRVALILDLLALIRSGTVRAFRSVLTENTAAARRRPCVMVVDDSLTVRRVTSRLLHQLGSGGGNPVSRGQTASTEVRGIVLPTGGADLLLPNAAVAEVVAYREPTPFASAPPWLLGSLTWRGRAVPLVSVAAAPAARSCARAGLVVCNLPNGRPNLPYVCILAWGPPRLARFGATALEPVAEAPNNPFVLHALTFAGRPAWIPNLDAIERAVLEALDL